MKQGSQSLVVSTTWNTLSSGVEHPIERERREAGVGSAIKKNIVTKLTEMPRPVSDRIMTMRLPLSKDNFATIISVYNQLASVLSADKLLLIGDFNARIGRDNDKWPLVVGKNGIGK